MTKLEYTQAEKWALKQADYKFALSRIQALSRYEMGKPRPNKDWQERMKDYEAECAQKYNIKY